MNTIPTNENLNFIPSNSSVSNSGVQDLPTNIFEGEKKKAKQTPHQVAIRRVKDTWLVNRSNIINHTQKTVAKIK